MQSFLTIRESLFAVSARAAFSCESISHAEAADAEIAQLVERNHAMVEATSSNLVFRSRTKNITSHIFVCMAEPGARLALCSVFFVVEICVRGRVNDASTNSSTQRPFFKDATLFKISCRCSSVGRARVFHTLCRRFDSDRLLQVFICMRFKLIR